MNIRVPFSALVLSVLCTNVSAGTLTGLVSAKGKEIPGAVAGGGKYDSRKFKFVETVDYAALSDFVVYIEGQVPEPVLKNDRDRVIMQQKEAKFIPKIMPIKVGTTVEWPNVDNIFHNVFSMSPPMPFDLGLYRNGEKKSISFSTPGRVDVFCSIHQNMHGVVLVLENSFFSSTSEDGRYTISEVPAGTYQLTAWHARLPAQSTEIVVTTQGETITNFELGVTGLPQY